MDLMGVVSLGWMWLKMAAASQRALAGGARTEPSMKRSSPPARFFATRELPLSTALRKKIEAGAEELMKVRWTPSSGFNSVVGDAIGFVGRSGRVLYSGVFGAAEIRGRVIVAGAVLALRRNNCRSHYKRLLWLL
jgi:hypothetical protein